MKTHIKVYSESSQKNNSACRISSERVGAFFGVFHRYLFSLRVHFPFISVEWCPTCWECWGYLFRFLERGRRKYPLLVLPLSRKYMQFWLWKHLNISVFFFFNGLRSHFGEKQLAFNFNTWAVIECSWPNKDLSFFFFRRDFWCFPISTLCRDLRDKLLNFSAIFSAIFFYWGSYMFLGLNP